MRATASLPEPSGKLFLVRKILTDAVVRRQCHAATYRVRRSRFKAGGPAHLFVTGAVAFVTRRVPPAQRV